MQPEAFIAARLPPTPVPGTRGVLLHLATPSSGLGRFLQVAGAEERPPYWAYVWGGGAALARHLSRHPQTVAGKRTLDLGAGSGLAAIAAAKAGARTSLAAEIDPLARLAIGLNARLNQVAVGVIGEDLTEGAPPDVDLILVSDLFYETDLAARVLGFLERCRVAGIAVLIGDPKRSTLPMAQLRLVAEYDAPDFGGTGGGAVFTLD